MNIYMKIGKRNEKMKKKREFRANWAGGWIFGPASAGERATACAGGPLSSPAGETSR
jgi:hypothetical protein